jgi:beta-lactamase class A
MLKALQKFLTVSLLLVGSLYLLYQGFLYSQTRALLPQGTTIADLDVSGLSLDEAAEWINEQYMTPVILYHRQERIEVNPEAVGFTLNMEAMLRQAETHRAQHTFWQGYAEFLLGRSLEPAQIELVATHDRAALVTQLQTIADFLDQPATPPQLLPASDTYEQGQPGFVTDVDASVADVEDALYRPHEREAYLVVRDEEAPSLDMDLLAANIRKQLDAFSGMGSVFILDLETGEEISINADVALSGLSVLKIAIFVEAYRVLDVPLNPYQEELFHNTAVLSSNYDANLLLHVVAGENNTYRGADILTESMRRLGLVNTFMAVPYDAPAVAHRQSTYTTPANSRSDISTRPDPARQTTAEEIGTLLSMIYYCAYGEGGTLQAIYPGEVTAEECQAIIEVMRLNTEGNLIRFGVPEEVPVSHKHGWDNNTHGDAGIVFSAGGDYVIVEFLAQPESDWLNYDISFPILREISRATYNYFNFENPNLEDPAQRSIREEAAREAEAAEETEAAEEASESAEPETTPEATETEEEAP